MLCHVAGPVEAFQDLLLSHPSELCCGSFQVFQPLPLPLPLSPEAS